MRLRAVTALIGSYRFTRLPFGLKIPPNSFQRMMTIAFSGLDPSQAFLYIDDLIVIGFSEKHMLKNLSDVFEKCRKFNLKNVHLFILLFINA